MLNIQSCWLYLRVLHATFSNGSPGEGGFPGESLTLPRYSGTVLDVPKIHRPEPSINCTHLRKGLE